MEQEPQVFYRPLVFFFFQAEDGIRDLTVTGVQTCALPIFLASGSSFPRSLPADGSGAQSAKRGSSPVTVAGAAPVSHRLPVHRRELLIGKELGRILRHPEPRRRRRISKCDGLAILRSFAVFAAQDDVTASSKTSRTTASDSSPA